MTFPPGNVQQDLRSKMSHVLPSSSKTSYCLLDSAHFTSSYLPGPLGFYTCASALPFSSRSSEDATEEVAFEQNLEIWIQLLCSFTTQRKISTNFTLIFLYHPHVPYLSAGQGNVSTICILESRQLEFPFSLCYLPDE